MNEAHQLPDLAYDYRALKPYISGEVIGAPHHLAADVKGANAALEQHADNPAGEDFAISTMPQVVNWADVAAPLAAARRLDA